jgi:hypothetical protein
MKYIYFFILLLLSISNITAQCPRKSLLEQFTSETCPPDATYNPALELKLDTNSSKIVAIKWHIPIPSAPGATWSPYQANKTENDWRYKSIPSGYGYPGQYSSSAAITGGISTSPTCLIDGQHQWVFGAANDHTMNFNSAIVNAANAVTSPFCVTMNSVWDTTSFASQTVTVSITASQNFSATGSLVYRLVMVEEEIHFATQAGTNGEKDFYNTARRSYPNIQNGTSLPSVWTSGQNQTFTINCVLPSSIIDKSKVKFIGFIQDDGNRMVLQAEETGTIAIKNDAWIKTIESGNLSCAPNYTPVIKLYNNGSNAITSFTIATAVDGITVSTSPFALILNPSSTATITLPNALVTSGIHTVAVSIIGVNGAGDLNAGNDLKTKIINATGTYFAPPLSEGFTSSTFPPLNWWKYNEDNGAFSWSRPSNIGAYGVNTGCVKYDFYNNIIIGDKDELILPPSDFTGLNNMMLGFDLAYAQYTNENDKLEVMVSTDCGVSWSTVYSKSGTNLSTSPSYSIGAFIPNSTQWRTEVITLTAFANIPEVYIKFVTTAAFGNSLYLDNINLTSTSNIRLHEERTPGIEVHPNPNNGEFTLIASEKGLYSILNSVGETIKTIDIKEGQQNIKTENLPAGIYYVVGKKEQIKLVITK